MKVSLKHIDLNGVPYIAATARFFAWPDIRDCAQSSGCAVEERRVGLISKRFKMTGTIPQLERFCDLAWKRDLPGFRSEIKRLAT
jgi:hypothetical protein